MRKVEIPIIYLSKTGEWINVCGLTYDDEGKILKVDAWDGDGVVTYGEGDFVVNEDNVAPLYQSSHFETNRNQLTEDLARYI